MQKQNELNDKLRERYNLSRTEQLDGAVLFGAGKLGQIFLSLFKKNGLNVTSFADNDPKRWGQEFNGLPIVSPESLPKEQLIVVTSRYSRDIFKQLAEAGFTNVVPHYILTTLFPDKFPEIFHMPSANIIQEEQADIAKFRSLLSDSVSTKLFDQILNFRETLDPEDIPKSAGPEKYFMEDIFRLKNDEVFVDVGAFDGDTIKDFIKETAGNFKRYYALEPDPISYDRLLGIIPAELQEKFTPVKAGAGSEKTTVSFSGGGNLESAVTENGDEKISIVTLDEITKDEPPTIIKMDIEGYEGEALKGAEETIRRYHPRLCISVYHNPWDLWRLPLQILSYYNYQNLYLRQYGEGMIETTLYVL